MSRPSLVHILVLAGQQRDAQALAARRYPACELSILSKTSLRESGWKAQLRQLRQLKGQALLIFTDSLDSLQEPLLLKWTVLLHQCRETVLADASGAVEVLTRASLAHLIPATLFAALADLAILASSWIGLLFFQVWPRFRGQPKPRPALFDLAYLFPSHVGFDAPGGARTHVTGFLNGLEQEGFRSVLLSASPPPLTSVICGIPRSRRPHLFREAAALSYNFRFIAAARKLLAHKPARVLYQRHGRFLFAGAVLSRWTGIPLALEYNASEEWMGKYWDPARFSRWIRLCERISVNAASLIVVVSDPLKDQLVKTGVPSARILVNPNAVDPDSFHPQCGGADLRHALGVPLQDTLVCFVGTFSYWHGVGVLEQAIRALLAAPPSAGPCLKFLLVGDGPLAPQLRTALEPFVRDGSVIFTGVIPHASVRAHLDAADILVSPHVPMPDGTPFFGSPTKLFEYMAMGKAIAASALAQIAEVLVHEETALLITPGDHLELTQAIQRLAADPLLRANLGQRARETALARHTWRQNARNVLAHSLHPVSSTDLTRHVTAGSATPAAARKNLAGQNLG